MAKTFKSKLLLDAVTAPVESESVYPDGASFGLQLHVETGSAQVEVLGRIFQHGGDLVVMDTVTVDAATTRSMILGYNSPIPEVRVRALAVTGGPLTVAAVWTNA